ncbi:MAG: IS110 family transposase [Clostridium sp.]|nr:IS110 family transposase [Clostridium sp.]
MALKIVYKICCGIDVHKTFVVACIASTDKHGVTSYERHRFSTYTKGLKNLLQWLLEHNCKDVCMESTGKYWIPVYNILEKDCSIVLAHPKYVKAIRGKKTDKKDAKWIADLFKHDLVSGSFMPPADIRQLRDLMRYRFKLTCFKSSEKNRLQNCLTVSNIQLGNVVSDTFGKSAQAILDKILENPEDTSFDQSRKAELEELILALAAPYQQELAILQTAPGISSDFTAIGIISEIGTNMEAFPSAKHLCSWAGLTPTNNESAGKKKSVRVSKAGCYIKPLLVQCANAVVKSSKHPEMRNRYLRLKKRRGHKKAIIAIARMLLTALYHMLKNGENYNAELYRKSDLPPVDREITVEQAILIARNQGYKIKSATA